LFPLNPQTINLVDSEKEKLQLLNSSIMKEIFAKGVVVCNCFCIFIAQDLVFWVVPKKQVKLSGESIWKNKI
jgi:hypothetical protein